MIRLNLLREILSYNSQWLIEQMSTDGRFLYQYEKSNNSYVGSKDPSEIQQSYYNIVRHSGSTIILLRTYECLGDKKYLDAAKKSITYFISTLCDKEIDSNKTYFPVYNKKSKLGAAGLGLASLIYYYRLSNEEQYREIIDGLVQHILSRIVENGELIAYYLHPLINDGKPIDSKFLSSLDQKQKNRLYSYYFPGEALLGLALYYQNIDNIPPDLKQTIIKKSLLALDFIVKERSNSHNKTNQNHSIDIWTMQAIEEWAKESDFQKTEYINYVFDQSNQFFEYMAEEEAILISEYVDASCCEGLISAYYLAIYLQRTEQANYIMSKLLHLSEELLAQELLSPQQNTISLNKHFDSERYTKQCLENFYCKLKHQSINMDLIHHLINFIARLLASNFDKLKIDNIPIEIIADYQLFQTIHCGEFADIFLGYHRLNKTKAVAIKKIAFQNNEPLIKQETKVISLFNIANKEKVTANKEKITEHKEKMTDDSSVFKPFYSESCFYSENYFYSENNAYFISDYYDKGNLDLWLSEERPVTETIAIQFLKDFLVTIKLMQNNCLLHLNINPKNILVGSNTDTGTFHFSLSAWHHSTFASFIKIETFDEYCLYLPPEIYKGYQTASSDIYTLGAVLYFMVEGKHVFNLNSSSSPAQIAYSHTLLNLSFSDKASPKLQFLISRMMDKNQRSRANVDEIEEIIYSNKIFNSEHHLNTTLPSENEQQLWELLADKGIPYASQKLS